MYRKILIAVDGSECSVEALQTGLKLAQALAASVVVVTITEKWSALEVAVQVRCGGDNPIEQYEKAALEAAKMIEYRVREVAEQLDAAFDFIHITDEHPAAGIVAAAKKHGCDLIVMGSHGRTGFDKLFIGSVAHDVLTLSPVPVLVDKAYQLK